jgi:hypothetical protein
MSNYQPPYKNPNWTYTRARYTNILESFRALGWIPPSELRKQSSAGLIND